MVALMNLLSLSLFNVTRLPEENTLFLIETSSKGYLSSRAACAIESAALTNQNWQINVLSTKDIKDAYLRNGDIVHLLKKYGNIQFVRIHMPEYAKGTPLEAMLAKGILKKSSFPIEHASDVVRLLTLYKYGGVYVDTDIIVVKSLDSLPKNFVAKEYGLDIGSAVIGASKNGVGKIFSELALREFNNTYDPKKWDYNGPMLLARVLKKLCNVSSLKEITTKKCHGFHVYSSDMFYPIYYATASEYFTPGEPGKLNLEQEYTHHIWNKMSKGEHTGLNSLYMKLAQKYCPVVFGIQGSKI